MQELKPCPFCGGEATFHTYGGTCNVVCDDCRIGTLRLGRIDEHEVIDAWNSRAERTCRNVSDPPEGFLCSECGWGDFAEPSHLLTGACYAGLAKGPRFCPNCGAKVVE